MGRRAGEDLATDSLDMLLDAMCNTFGAVIFIALLLSVMSFFSHPRTASDAAEEAKEETVAARVAALERETSLAGSVVELLADAQSLTGAADEQRRLLREERAERLRAALADAERERRTLADALAVTRERTEALERETRRYERRLAALARMARLPEEQLALPASEAPAAPNHYAARLPVLRATEHKPFYLVVRWGRVYPLFRIETDGRLVPERDGLRFDDRPDGVTYVTPVRGRGMVPGTAGSPAPEFAALVADLLRIGRYADFSVYGDSYETFIQARNYLGGQGLDYQWEPIADNHSLTLKRGTPNPVTQ